MLFTLQQKLLFPGHIEVRECPSFHDFYLHLLEIREDLAKEDTPLLLPVSEWTTLHRRADHVVTFSPLAFLDLDGLADAELDDVVDAVRPYTHFGYSTHSHGKGKGNCYRIVLALTSGYPAAHHKHLFNTLTTTFPHIDRQCSDLARGYYMPVLGCEMWYSSGRSFPAPDPSQVPTADHRPATQAPTLYALESQLQAWSRQAKDHERRQVAKDALQYLRGKSPIPIGHGRRYAYLISLLGYLAHRWPDADPNAMAAHFDPTLQMFSPDAKYPVDKWVEVLGSLQSKEQAARADAAEQAAAEQARIIQAQTGGERSHTITDDEVTHLAGVYGEQWHEHIIGIYKRDLYYLRPDGTYDPDPVSKDWLSVAARDRLAIFGDYIKYTYVDDRGEHRKSPGRFLDDYGTVVRSVVYDYTRPRGGYDPTTETIYLAAAAPVVDPVHHPDVHEWLEALGPSLMDMMTALPELGRPLPALVLTGPGAAGKTLLGVGAGQIYGRGPVDAEAAFDRYNASALVKQPIVLMDEKAASLYRTEGTTLVRRWVTQEVRLLDEKYQARVELIGYPRLIVAANNADVLSTAEDMTAEDREAYAERLVHVDVTPGVAVLEKHRHKIQSEWLDQRHLAEHILWLHHNREVQFPGRRFLVAQNQTELHRSLAGKAGSAADVACWLLEYCAAPARATHLPVGFHGKKLRVNSSAIVQGWSVYLRHHRPPSPGAIAKALKSLSRTGYQKLTCTIAGKSHQYNTYEIDPELLRDANDNYQILSNFDEIFIDKD